VQQLLDRVVREHLAVARAIEAPRRRSTTTIASVASSSAASSQCCTASARATRSADSRFVSAIASTNPTSSPMCVASRARRNSCRARRTSDNDTPATIHPRTATTTTIEVTGDPEHQEHARARPLTRTDP
jgi:hypothetical protein